MAFKWGTTGGPRHWYYYVLALLCVGWWNAIDYISLVDHVVTARPRIRSENQLYPSNVALINLTDFRYVINNPCSSNRDTSPWEMIVLVTSNAKDFDLRAAQREAFPTRVLENAGIKRVFLLARDAAVSQSEVEAENESHRDIVQGNFEELYRQLGYKHIMGLQWAVTYCRNARYILKMDDDIMVDFYQLLAKLQSDYPSLDNVVLGYKQFGLTPQRNRKSKWFVSKAEFAGNVYPDFLSGWAWATSTSTAVRLVNQSRRVPFFWIDDLWVTGVLAGVAGGIRVESLNTFYTVYAEHMECCVAEENTDKLCDFIVGPSLDRTELIVKFGRLSQRCHEMGCERRTWKDSVVKTCVKIDNPYFLPHNSPGVGEVIVLPNKMLL